MNKNRLSTQIWKVKIMRQKGIIAMIVLFSMIITMFTGVIICREEAEAANYNVSNPTRNSEGVTTWDCVYLGNYWQNDTNGDGVADQEDEKDPIKWRVLSVEGNDAFLLADKILDNQAYDEEYNDYWGNCTLRTWLNDDFYDIAFSQNEQSAIKITSVVNNDDTLYEDDDAYGNSEDKIFLLSDAEIFENKYGFSGDEYNSSKDNALTRLASYSNYSYDKSYAYGNYDESYINGKKGPWWTRGFIWTAADTRYKSYVNNTYGSLGNGVVTRRYGIRPVIHLDLSSPLWSSAGTVSSSDEESAEPTSTPMQKTNFQLGEDNNSFIHNRAYSNVKDKNQFYCDANATYKTESSYLKAISSDLYEYLALLRQSLNDWNGSCYGISLGMLLNKANKVDLDSFGVESFYDIKPYSNTVARKYLNFLYLSQFSSKYGGGKMTAATTRKDGKGNYTKKEFFERFVNAVKTCEENGLPVMFLFVTPGGGHAIIATSVKEESDRYLVTMYDMNTVQSNSSNPKGKVLTMTVAKDYSDFIFKDGNGDNIGGEYLELRFLDTNKLINAPFGNAKNDKKNLSFKNLETYEVNDVYDETNIILSDNTEVKNANGNTLEYANGEMSGDMEVFDSSPVYRSIENSEDGSVDYSVQMPLSKSYMIESQEKSVDVMLYDEGRFVAVNGNDVKSITADNEKIEIEGSSADYNITLPSKSDNCSLYELDITSNDAVYNYEGDKLKITSETGMSNIIVSACCDMDYIGKESVSITANEIEIVPDENEVDKVNIIANNKDGDSEIISLTMEQVSEDGLVSTPSPILTPKPAVKPTASPKPTVKPTAPPKTSFQKVKGPRKVKGVSVRAKKGRKIKVSWDIDYENTFGYHIQYAQNKRFTKKKKKKIIAGWTHGRKTIKGLSKGKIYYVRVRAYNKKYGKKVYGKWSKVKKVKIKK